MKKELERKIASYKKSISDCETELASLNAKGWNLGDYRTQRREKTVRYNLKRNEGILADLEIELAELNAK